MALRAIEFVLLFLAGPTLFAYARHRFPAIPALWATTACCLFVLLRDPHFNRARLWNAANTLRYLPEILSLYAVVTLIGIVLVLRYTREHFLNLPRSNPFLWALVMIVYPVLSVYPQGVVYRAFIFDRYLGLFGPGWGIVLASAVVFAYVHIVFRNALAVVLTFLAGLLFAYRYWETGSLFISSFEHALYGCTIFTIGLGRWFYHDAVRR